MPGIGLLIDGAVQHAPQPGRQFGAARGAGAVVLTGRAWVNRGSPVGRRAGAQGCTARCRRGTPPLSTIQAPIRPGDCLAAAPPAVLHPQSFDVIVIGGGHAGTEAALAAARMGAATLLLTHNIETLGQMSCNPSIGGIGKGHLVKEVDALGGAMAAATDEGGIQFRILNSSKGPAVRATRAQADRILYKAAIRRRLENQPNLWLFQQAVDDLMLEGDRVVGAVTQSGIRFRGRAVVLTAGTFLDGRVHIGLQNHAAGRAGDPPAVSLSARLKELKLPQGRLKTGTPPRIDGRSIDFSRLAEQPGDGVPQVGRWGESAPTGPAVPVFSFLGSADQHPRQVPCWITHTNARTHEIIRSGFDHIAHQIVRTGLIGGVVAPFGGISDFDAHLGKLFERLLLRGIAHPVQLVDAGIHRPADFDHQRVDLVLGGRGKIARHISATNRLAQHVIGEGDRAPPTRSHICLAT